MAGAGRLLPVALTLTLAPSSSLASSRSQPEQFIVSGAACGLAKATDGVHTLYWQALDAYEACVKPDLVAGGAAELYFVAAFRDRGTARGLLDILIRAHSATTIGEASFNQPRFRLNAGGTELDLAPASGRAYQFVYPCNQSPDGCAYTGIISRLTLQELVDLSNASRISGHVQGADFELAPSGIEAIRRLVRISDTTLKSLPNVTSMK